MASQTNQLTIGRVGLDACSVCMVVQKIMEPELHHEVTQPLRWRRRNARLDVHKYSETDNHELLARAWQAANEKARELGWIV